MSVLNKPGSEAEVIRQAQLGDQAAFEEIYRKHRRRVYSVCARITHNPAEAEELTQETFLQLYRKIGSFRGDSTLWTWLYRVTLNIAFMSTRRMQPVSPIEHTLSDSGDSEQASPDLAREDELLTGSVNRVTLLAAIDRLAPGYRMVLWLHDVLGYEHGEIAEIMGCTMGSSKSQLHKARLKMRAELLRAPVQKDARHLRESETTTRPLRGHPAKRLPSSVAGSAMLLA